MKVMKQNLMFLVSVSIPLLMTPFSSFAQDSAVEQRESEGGNGLTFEAALTLEYISNVSGGIRRDSAFLGNVDVTAELDTEEAGLWKGGTFFIYGLGNFNGGTYPSEVVGDIQATSNIEAPDTFKLYEAWYNQSFRDDTLSLLVGLHDYNSEFDVLEYAGVFPNSSFGIAPQISQVGPSIFPTTALALRLAAKPTDKSYVLAAVYDGVPGDPDNERSGAIKFDSGDGIFSALEVGLSPEEDAGSAYYKFSIGGWYHTAETEDFEAHAQDRNGGVYLLAERQVYQEADHSQGLGVFGQFGTAIPDRSEVAYSIMAGLNYTGLIEGRDEDVIGLAFCSAILSDDFRAIEGNEDLDAAETVIDFVYQAHLTDWLTVQPDIQYIMNPASESGLDNALQLGVRMEIGF